jgi:hypothetical protein
MDLLALLLLSLLNFSAFCLLPVRRETKLISRLRKNSSLEVHEMDVTM